MSEVSRIGQSESCVECRISSRQHRSNQVRSGCCSTHTHTHGESQSGTVLSVVVAVVYPRTEPH